jgi:hypothetical protein
VTTNRLTAPAAYELAWALKLHALMQETAAAVKLVAILGGDKGTQRGLIDGDPAARRETLHLFAHLGTLEARYRNTLAPAPKRWHTPGAMVERAFALLAEAATSFVEATEGVIDLDGIETVGRCLGEAGHLFTDAVRVAACQANSTLPLPETHGKRSARRTDD